MEISRGTRIKISEAAWQTSRALAVRDDNYLKPILERSRFGKEEAYASLDEYGADFVPPPLGAYEDVDIIEVDGDGNDYALCIYLWSKDSQETDFSAELSIRIVINAVLVKIDSLRIM